ncbi:MAG: hypothetical protein R3E08_07045 [Thiotrichaceae bacterium]
MKTIYIFIQAFLQICLFKHKPQDLPASTTLLIMVLAIYMLMSAILAPASLSMGRSFLWSLVETVLLTGSVASLLYMTKRPERITQTLTALAGTDSLLSLLSVPFVIWIDQGKLQFQPNSSNYLYVNIDVMESDYSYSYSTPCPQCLNIYRAGDYLYFTVIDRHCSAIVIS